MDAVAPGVAKGFHHFGLAGDVVGVAVFHVAAGGAPLKVAVELDAIGRVKVNALHFAAQAFALGKTRHHLQAVTQDHAVGPMLFVLVELGLGVAFWHAVEVFGGIAKQVGHKATLCSCVSRFGLVGLTLQVVNQHLGVYFFLNVKRRGIDHQV